VAETLIAETLADPGAVEIGVRGPDRFAITLVEAPAVADGTGLKLSAESVYLATGAAGGITSAIVTDLAAANGGIYYLLDLTPLPGDDDERIALFRAGRDNLKQHLIAAARSAGERPTPATIDRQILDVERQEAALRAVETIRAAGGTAHYRRVDLLDGEAVAAVVDEIRQRHGRLDVLIHAAGLEISRTLAEKPPAQFNLVYDVKADGYFNLLRAAAGLPIGAVVVFSSVAGRFGNAGQTDYAAANDLLCRQISSLRAWRSATRGVAIDWSAWSGIGMATRGSIPKLMEAAGIERVPPEAGVPTVRRELTYSAFSGEVVVAGKLGLLLDEWDPAGGLDLERAQARAQQPPQVMIGTIKAARLYGGWEVETTLDPQVQPFLHDHALEGTPLLPGVMGIEAFAELAHLAAPGYVVTGARNVRFERPLKFYRGQPRTLTLTLSLLREADGGLRAAGTLRSTRQPRPDLPAQSQVHFTGEVCLGRQAPTAAATAAPPRPSARDAAIGHEAIYRKFFHGPAYQVLEQAHIGTDQAVGVWRAKLPDDAVPAGGASQIGPRLIELCFQTAGLWEMEMKHRLGLPRGLGAVTVLARAGQGPRGALYAVVRPVAGGDQFEGGVVDEQGKVYLSFSDYQTVPLDLGEREPEAATANAAVR
jgi:NAD(P)-dependent dehydrogenase (short-subunit alcohol dehydrogenase family)